MSWLVFQTNRTVYRTQLLPLLPGQSLLWNILLGTTGQGHCKPKRTAREGGPAMMCHK